MHVQAAEPLMSLFYKIFMGMLVAGGIALIMWPFRKLAAIHNELIAQRTNCLQTLQNQGGKQIELLGKAVTTLEGIHTSQASMTGFMQATQIIAAPAMASRRRKR